ncbi:hypothetical protein FQN51_006828 [Onygenales sp. PD_10]|nr:hypothetical protein FQN51_006828 [Onygenales sp. PD_10]
MPPTWVPNPFAASLPDHCEPSGPFLTAISSHLHTCIPTPLALISSTLGTLSIVSWLFAQLPQIYKNYRRQSTSGLSALFLVEWCLGDTTNLLGAIFLHQAGWQITVAAYYVFVDVVLVIQYYWYTYLRGWRTRRQSYATPNDQVDNDSDSWDAAVPTEGRPIRSISPSSSVKRSDIKNLASNNGLPAGSPLSSTLSFPNEKPNSPSRTIIRSGGSGSATPFASPRTVLFISMLCAVLANATSEPSNRSDIHTLGQSNEDAKQIAGRILSWASTFLYLVSRLPQLYKNYGRQSTSGLSPLLFFAAFCGNFFYSTSLLTNPNGWSDFPAYGGGGWAGKDGNNRLEWIGRAVPFFLGAAGVLGLDAAMGIQFLMYGEGNDVDAIKYKPTGRGRSKWRRVSGWMRGWVPSMSPERKTPAGETEALLPDTQDRYGGV